MNLISSITMGFAPPRRGSGWLRLLLASIFIVGSLFYLRMSSPTFNSVHQPIDVTPGHLPGVPAPQNPTIPGVKPAGPVPAHGAKHSTHPIDTLIEKAEGVHNALLKKESRDIESAAAAYRERRGRHPPPGFDLWYEFAAKHDAIIVEDYFDQIYHDLGPFWGLPPKVMRREASTYEMRINIRNGKASTGSDWFWTVIWLNLTSTIEHLLPDMDLSLNAMDEPRIVTPWEEIDKLMELERQSRKMPPATEVVTKFSKLPLDPEPNVEVLDKKWEDTRPYWKIASRGCPPSSLARTTKNVKDLSKTPEISLANTAAHTYKDYVSNFSLSVDFCHQPDLQALHGMMINPLTVSSTATLFPLFGGSKLSTNNEILLPAPMYWNGEDRFTGGDNPGIAWHEKLDKVIWRGVATGGRHNIKNWKGFQRHRFVSMTNASLVAATESGAHDPQNWALPPTSFDLAAQQEKNLGAWTREWADTGFTSLMCGDLDGDCSYMTDNFDVVPGIDMADQFNRKYLPDIDGNSFSGRYRGFLMSTALPIKATIFREWHDSRLVPWKHFVPMDNRFMDFWGIMQYFLGYESERTRVAGHDAQAQKIADDGQAWANKVLRPEDMQIYVLRLLLEYARLTDNNRDNMGWVRDLL